MMTIQFQNTLDDYREASGIPTGAKRGKMWGRMLVWVSLVIAAFTVMLFFGTLGSRDAVPGEAFPWKRLALVLTPSVILFGLIAWGLFRAGWKVPEPWNPPPDRPRPSLAPMLRGIGGWMMFLILAIYLFKLLNQWEPTPGAPASAPPPVAERLPSYFEHLLPLLGWVFLFGMLMVFNRVQRSRVLPRAWAAMRHENEARVAHVTESGVVLEQPSARQEYRWDHFPGYRETDNLVLLYTSPYASFMIPKRAFADGIELAAFKSLVMSGIPQGHFLPTASHAFPVLPAAPVAPAPSDPGTSTSAPPGADR